MPDVPERVVLIGPSGAGKSSIARALGERLGKPVIDTDDELSERIGMPITEFFARYGEPAFRAIEREVVAQACQQGPAVIATGGGAVLFDENWAVWRPNSVVVGLSADPETLVGRVTRQTGADGERAERPLLAGNAEERIRALVAQRSALYAQADVTIDTSALDHAAAIEAVVRAVMQHSAGGLSPRLSLLTPSGRSDIYVGRGVRSQLGQTIHQRWPRSRRAWVVSDENVAARWADEVCESLERDGLRADLLVVQPGETTKSLTDVERLCKQMTEGGATRRDVVIALGGGVVGDLAGFVASICLRGLALVQVPTSLLAMVDSSVGGKTGVNLPAGKNLAGAFYQPGVVLIDPAFLDSLPQAEYRSGMAEVIKHSLIQPSTPLGGTTLLETLQEVELDPLPAEQVEEILALNVAIKASVVAADEREAGLRMVLNFGHTAGHAIEADGYRYRHGEAIGLGLLTIIGAAVAMGRVPETDLDRVRALLNRAGLPTDLETDIEQVLSNLTHDKKNVDGAIHWVLPVRDGGVELETDVAIDDVRRSLLALTRE
ncbi:MAG: 3-dehydroquinate synthase [Thermomicrobiales bacterium]|nr:3-dehydroquinate synthase [Thermomicrobiales bacterium]